MLLDGIEMLWPFNTSGNPGRYFNVALINSILPSVGQFIADSSVRVVRGASPGMLKYCWILSTATKFASRSLDILTVQFKVLVMERANERESPASPTSRTKYMKIETLLSSYK